MKDVRVQPLSVLGGFGLATLVFLTMGQKGTKIERPEVTTEFRIVEDPAAEDLGQLAKEGWQYAGYLGEGTKGSGNDQTLWKRTSK